jgi:hypothetical protein
LTREEPLDYTLPKLSRRKKMDVRKRGKKPPLPRSRDGNENLVATVMNET